MGHGEGMGREGGGSTSSSSIDLSAPTSGYGHEFYSHRYGDPSAGPTFHHNSIDLRQPVLRG